MDYYDPFKSFRNGIKGLRELILVPIIAVFLAEYFKEVNWKVILVKATVVLVTSATIVLFITSLADLVVLIIRPDRWRISYLVQDLEELKIFRDKSDIVTITNNKQPAGLRPSVNLKGERWTFHLTDDDPFPSRPHGHSDDNRRKLNIYSGEVIDKSGRILGIAKKKELNELMKDKTFKKYLKEVEKYQISKKSVGKFPETQKKFQLKDAIFTTYLFIDYSE